jgi:hypothetical protein
VASLRALAAKAIRQGVKLLATHPEAGPVIEDMPPEFRQWPIAFGAGGHIALDR